MITTKSALKSKINVANIIGFVVVLLAYLGEQSIIPGTIAAFIVFVLNVVLQKFFSSKPIFLTGVNASWMIYLINGIGAIVLIAEYIMQHHLFGIPPELLAMVIFILNLILRTFFTNQPKLN